MRKEYTNEDAALRFQRRLRKAGIISTIFRAYNWREQAEIYTVQYEGKEDCDDE